METRRGLVHPEHAAHILRKGFKPIGAIPVPWAADRSHSLPHATTFLLADGRHVTLFNSAPRYYRHRNNTWRPVEEVCTKVGNRHFILNPSTMWKIHPLFLTSWQRRQVSLGGTLVVDSPYGNALQWFYRNTDLSQPVGLTVSTFTPDADPETNTVDGYIYQSTNNFSGSTWDDWHDSDGTGATPIDDTSALSVLVQRQANGGWRGERGVTLFDTSSIGNSSTVSDADYEMDFVSSDGNDDDDGNDFIAVLTSSITSNTSLAADDFDNVGDAIDNPTEMHDTSERKDITSLSGSTTWTFNSTGIAAISKDDISKFGIREGHDILDDQPDLSGGGSRNEAGFNSAEAGSNIPTLTVTYTAGTPTQNSGFFHFI